MFDVIKSLSEIEKKIFKKTYVFCPFHDHQQLMTRWRIEVELIMNSIAETSFFTVCLALSLSYTHFTYYALFIIIIISYLILSSRALTSIIIILTFFAFFSLNELPKRKKVIFNYILGSVCTFFLRLLFFTSSIQFDLKCLLTELMLWCYILSFYCLLLTKSCI
jgi:hypothetical protein